MLVDLADKLRQPYSVLVCDYSVVFWLKFNQILLLDKKNYKLLENTETSGMANN